MVCFLCPKIWWYLGTANSFWMKICIDLHRGISPSLSSGLLDYEMIIKLDLPILTEHRILYYTFMTTFLCCKLALAINLIFLHVTSIIVKINFSEKAEILYICWFNFDALAQDDAYSPQISRWIIVDQVGIELTTSRLRNTASRHLFHATEIVRVPTQPGKREKSVKLNIALPALEKSLN